MRETEAFNYDAKLALNSDHQGQNAYSEPLLSKIEGIIQERLVPIHVSPDCEDVAPAAPREERRLTSLRLRLTLVIMGLDIHAPVFIISPNDRFCI